MIVRVVKMTFQSEKVDDFKQIFEKNKSHIRNFPGVSHLELLQDVHEPNIFFTYSHWEQLQDLENYRNSDLFQKVWSETKPLFAKKAEAWSTDRAQHLP